MMKIGIVFLLALYISCVQAQNKGCNDALKEFCDEPSVCRKETCGKALANGTEKFKKAILKEHNKRRYV